MSHNISIKLFGGIRILREQTWVALNDLSEKPIGKKQQAFLTYLLINHERKITPAELIENFWNDENKDPANSLKNMLHKIRALLRAVFPDVEDPILTQTGGYVWNSSLHLELDTDTFEQFYRSAKNAATAESTAPAMQAFELYSGDILPGTSAGWLDHLNTYYRTVYIDICRALAVRLLEEAQWDESIRVCKEAYALAPEVETFTICAMHAMTASGQPRQAVKRYEEYRTLLWEQYSLVPSSETERAYTLAVEAAQNPDDFQQALVDQLTQPAEQGESFHCSLMVFQNIVQLELRHMRRSKHPSCIAVLQIGTTGSTDPSPTDIRRMERILLQTLRAGDPFTRLNMGSFALLLSGATEENAVRVMDRIRSAFHNTYPRSRAILRYQVYPMTTNEES